MQSEYLKVQPFILYRLQTNLRVLRKQFLRFGIACQTRLSDTVEESETNFATFEFSF